MACGIPATTLYPCQSLHKVFDFQNSHRANFFPTGPFDLKIGSELVLGIRYEINATPKIVT